MSHRVRIEPGGSGGKARVVCDDCPGWQFPPDQDFGPGIEAQIAYRIHRDRGLQRRIAKPLEARWRT